MHCRYSNLDRKVPSFHPNWNAEEDAACAVRDTGGTCDGFWGGDCDKSRGAQCKDKKCMCGENEVSCEGRCVQISLYDKKCDTDDENPFRYAVKDISAFQKASYHGYSYDCTPGRRRRSVEGRDLVDCDAGRNAICGPIYDTRTFGSCLCAPGTCPKDGKCI